ncbi:MAG: hypothetical protein ACK5MA_05965 [Parachlamydiaceae bacterium]
MEALPLTILLASVIVLLAILGLAIGWLITGKSKIRGSCGRGANKDKDDSCGTSTTCEICRKDKKDE